MDTAVEPFGEEFHYDIARYARKDRAALFALIEGAIRVHMHLDWTTIDDWIADPGAIILLARRNGALFGAMSLSPALGGASWLRMVAIHDDVEAVPLLMQLWTAIKSNLIGTPTRSVHILALRHWMVGSILTMGFSVEEDLITLARISGLNPPPLRGDIVIQRGELRDIGIIVEVDHAAFHSLWQMSADSLRQAVRGSNSFTIAYLNGEPTGYQIAMRYTDGGHLARLAVIPTMQGMGIGGALLHQLITSYEERGLSRITVNTQASNRQSLSLYERYGFAQSGTRYLVYSLKL